MIKAEYTNKVRELRARHKVTQEAAAEFLGMNVATFRAKEDGKSEWRMSEMFMIVYYFNYYHLDNLNLEDVFM